MSIALAALLLGLLGAKPGVAADGVWFTLGASGMLERSHCADAFDTRRDRTLSFGGVYTKNGTGGATYVIDIDSTLALEFSNGWSPIPLLTSVSPPPRAFAAAAYDSTSDRLSLFGGRRTVQQNPGGWPPTYAYAALADLWRLDLSGSPAWSPVQTAGTRPSARYSHALVADPVGRRLVLFGGRDSLGQYFGDLWTLDLDASAPAWTPLATPGPAPSARAGAVYAFDPVSRRLYLHGGHDGLQTLTDTWVLDLSAAPQWTSIAPAGNAPAGPVSAAWDVRRGHLFVLRSDGGASALELTPSPHWTGLTLDEPSSYMTPGSTTGRSSPISYDARRDLLLLPFAGRSEVFFYDDRAKHHLLALDQSPAPATLAPELISYRFGRGTLRTRLRLHRDAGLLYEMPGLERLGYGASPPGLGPVFYDAAADTAVFVDELAYIVPNSTTRWRLAWQDPYASHASAELPIEVPPQPLTMEAVVDSAVVYGGALHLQWTVGDDSLSFVTQPLIMRWRVATGWQAMMGVWPDSLRRVRVSDPSLATGEEFRYRIDWQCPTGTCAMGETSVTIGDPIPVLAQRVQPGLGTYVRWHVAPPFTVRLERRLTADGIWQVRGTLAADTGGDIVATDRAFPLGTHVEYRLGWDDAGAVAHTPAVVFDVPPFSADGAVVQTGTHRIQLRWSIWPFDSLLQLRVWRADLPSRIGHPIGSEFPGTPRAIGFTDTTVVPGREYAYWLVADDGTQQAVSGAAAGTAASPPVILDARLVAGQLHFDWWPTADAQSYILWKRVGGPDQSFEAVGQFAAGLNQYSFLSAAPPDRQAATMRLEWRESDGRTWALPDTTLGTADSASAGALSFALGSANPVGGEIRFVYALPDSRLARLQVYDVRGRLRLMARTTGPGRGVWTFARGTLEPGLYWARIVHPSRTRTIRLVVL